MALLKGLGQHEGHQGRRQFDAGHHVPGITQSIPIAPGPPPLEQYAPGIPVRGVSPPAPFLVHSPSYCASDCRRCQPTGLLVTYLLIM